VLIVCCIYGVWRSDCMVFTVFMECDVLIGWFLLYLWGVTFWLRVLESFMNRMKHDRIFKILISACKQCLPPLFTLFVLDCLVMFKWCSDWMVFAVFMGCDILIGWFLLYLWGVTFWLDGFCCIYGVWRSDWMVFAVFMGCAKTIQSEHHTP
jgi:hypothetical protein